MSDGKTITQILEEVKEEVCTNICRYPFEYEDFERMLAEKCEDCPLDRL